MAEVKWVKLTTDMFDNRKIKHLRRLPEGNNIVLLWVMLLTMAGRCNSGGMIFLTENIPYTSKMLADELGFEENTVKLALTTLEQLNMIVTDHGFFSIAGWEEYQNIEGMDKIREQNRLRQKKQRKKRKAALIGDGGVCEYCGGQGTTVDHIVPRSKGGADSPENTVCSCLSCNMHKTDRNVADFLNVKISEDPTFDVGRILGNGKLMNYVLYDGKRFLSRDVTGRVTPCHATEEDIEEELEKEKEIYETVVSYLNKKAGTNYRATTAKTRTAIHARLAENFTVEDFKTVIDKKCDEWIGTEYEKYLRPETLFGNKFEGYLNAKQTAKKDQQPRQQYRKQTKADELQDAYSMMAEWSQDGS